MSATPRPPVRFGDLVQRWRGRGLAFLAGIATAAAASGLGALALVQFGLFDTAATKPDEFLFSWAAHATFQHSTRMRTHIRAPAHFTPAQVRAGLAQYQADCVMCHGGPGVAQATWVRGLNPPPPYILDTAYRWTPAQLDDILEDGVKMSAMPAWGETRSHDEIWSLVAFLEALPNLSAADYARMAQTTPPAEHPRVVPVVLGKTPPNPQATLSSAR